MRLDIAAQTDIGRRKKKNEDSCGVFRDDTPGLRFFEEGALLCVADGLGGHLGGEIASKLAVSHVKDLLKEDPPPMPNGVDDVDARAVGPLKAIRTSILRANDSIYRDNLAHGLVANGTAMGTTMLAVLIEPGQAYVGNVGDSRCYLIRDGEIVGHTEDHSWVDEQVKLGLMSKAEAAVDRRKNVVTRCVGTHPETEVDTYRWALSPGDLLLLCTDGLVNMVTDDDIKRILRKNGTAAEMAQALVSLANENGGKDNITVIIANISPSLVRLFLLRLRAFLRDHGIAIGWYLLGLLYSMGLFAAGYLFRLYSTR